MPDETPQPFETREEFEAAETKVLHPEADTRTVEFGKVKVELRALPIGVERTLMSLLAEVKRAEAENSFEVLYSKAMRACQVLAEFYKVPGVDAAWIDANIGMDQAIDILNAQVERGLASRFLASAAHGLFEPVRELCRGLEEADLTAVREYGRNLFKDVGVLPGSTPPSAKPGT
jgi:hypothetical protein